MKMDISVYVGLLVDTREDGSLRTEKGILVIQGNSILDRTEVDDLEMVVSKYTVPRENVVVLTASQFLVPGFIDTHIHASQLPNAGIALDLALLEWLEKYTFPTEAKFAELQFAYQVYERCIRTTLDSGTTTAVYFATIHRESSEILAAACKRLGQRAFIGKVCMDRNSPEYYVEDTDQSIQQTIRFVQKVEEIGEDLVKPIITPRFVPSVSRNLMEKLGELSSAKNLAIQTHISENKKEVLWVSQLEPDCDTYAQVYDKCGLLNERTILAHGVHLTDQELKLIKKTGAGLAHCPNSNFSLKSGVCDVKRVQAAGIKVGLGTDCSGGYSTSLQDSMRLAVLASNTIKSTKEDEKYSPLTFVDALHLATRGGASLLNMQETLGALQPGMLADFLLVDMEGQDSTVPFGAESTSDLVQKFIFLGDDRNIAKVVVNGKLVKGS